MLKVAGFDASFEWTLRDHPSFKFFWRRNKNDSLKINHAIASGKGMKLHIMSTSSTINSHHDIAARTRQESRCSFQHFPEAHWFFFSLSGHFYLFELRSARFDILKECIASPSIFFEWVIFTILRWEYCNLKNDIQAAWYWCSQPFSRMQIALILLICNLLICCTFLVYIMEDCPVPKRARRCTVCDACGKHFASSFGFDQHRRSGYLCFFSMPRSRWWIHPHPIGGHITADHVDSHAAETEALSTKQQYH